MDPEYLAAFAQYSSSRAQEGVESAPANDTSSPVELVREQARATVDPFMVHYASKLPPASSYELQEKVITVQDGTMRLRCIIPTAKDGSSFPVLVWFHSGGWVVGDIDQDDSHLRSVCVDLQLCIVNVDYRLAPEHPFPTGLNDAYAAVKWVAANSAGIGASLSKGFILGGDSAGANLAAVCAVLTREDPFFADRQPTGQLLREPSIIHPDAYPEQYASELRSLEEYKDGPMLTKDALLQLLTLLGAPPTDPRISPLLFPVHKRAGLPPAVITANGADPLRDDARLYARVLRDAGVAVRYILYPGVPHAFYYTFPEIGLAEKMDRDTREGLRWLLAGAPSQTCEGVSL
ncbi:Alpha/Beta hydrolase protein [Trametes polyzona]|nr:Alpha/Beta hydrolase protein [Trametes polyzona]